MNVYHCCYQGITGYGFRTYGKRWMFVPELGQPDNRIYKNISLYELQFRNFFEKQFEMELERKLGLYRLSRFFKSLISLECKPQTVSGLLFHRF